MYENMMCKTILVTGAGGGIGSSLCNALAEAGANVIAVARNPAQLEELEKQQPTIRPLKIDLQNWQEVREQLKQVPPLDGLVNNAGIAYIKPFWELSEEEFDNTFDVNIKAVFNVTQALLPKLKENSSVVMVSSLASSRAADGHSAVDALTRSLALELGPRKIRVNSVNPTVVWTKMGRAIWSDPEKNGPLLSHIPMRRFCEVSEVVDTIVYLLSNKSSFVNGHHLYLEGGYCAS